jgi:PhzF family phenazine biosynthesis protein
MNIEVKIINAFSVDGKGGNPAGVILSADHLSVEHKQIVAGKLGFSETAFVSKSDVAEFKLDFFTPTKQIPHCGHATIGTFTYLKKTGFISGQHSSKETIDGIRKIVFKNGHAFMEQKAPFYETLNDDKIQAVLASLKLPAAEVFPGLTPTIVNTGNRFLIVPVKREKILGNLTPVLEQIASISEKFGLIGYYLYTPVVGTAIQVTTRMFAPFYGIEEEAATGMAAGPLACYLYDIVGQRQARYLIEQGRFMVQPSRSLLEVHLVTTSHKIQKLYVGGDAYVLSEVSIEI